LIILSSGSRSYGSSSNLEHWSDWENAKNSYDAQKFQEALHELQKHPKNDANYFYDVGTIYYRIGKLGEAVAYLEKANRLRPHDPDIQHNITIVRSALGRSIGPEKVDPASSWTEQLADRISLDEVRATLGLVGILLVLVWIRVYLKSHCVRRLFLEPSSLIALLAFTITAGIYGIQRGSEANPPAIVLQKQVIRSGPGDHYLELSQVEEGSKVRLLGPSAKNTFRPHKSDEPEETWRQIRFSSDGIGWIRSSSLLTL
jgi:Flp pilus assembly protein TadD